MKIVILVLLLSNSTILAHHKNTNPAINTVNVDAGVNKKVVKEWKQSLAKISTVNSTSYIVKKSGGKDKLHRVGHRDAIIWIPNSTDLSKDTTVIFWFHGHYGYVPHRTFEDRTLKQFVPLSKKNIVLVIPEMPWSVHTKTPTKRNSQLWKKKGDFMKFVDQVKGIMRRHNEQQPIGNLEYRVVGHSAGGSTIKRLGITGDLCKLNPTMVVWSDSSYGRWLDNAWDGCLKETNIVVKVFVHRWGSPYRQATRFLGQFQDPPSNIELHVKSKGWSHKLIGNNVVRLSNLLED